MLPLKALGGWGESFLVSPSFWWWPTVLGISRFKAVSLQSLPPLLHDHLPSVCVSLHLPCVCLSVSPFPFLSFAASGPSRVTRVFVTSRGAPDVMHGL